MFSRLRAVSFALTISVALTALAQDTGNRQKVLEVKSRGTAKALVHFDPALLAKYSLDGSDLARSAASILDFERATWGFSGPVTWDVYMSDRTNYKMAEQTKDPVEALGTTDYSATIKVEGATSPGPLACVSHIGLQNIEESVPGAISSRRLEAPFSWRVAYTMAHEATHCYQGQTSKKHKDPPDYPGVKWLTEGVATWLAGDYIESLGRPYPSYHEVSFRDYHRESLLTHAFSNHFFFKWLEGAQALKTRAAVVAFVTDLYEVAWPKAANFRAERQRQHRPPAHHRIKRVGDRVDPRVRRHRRLGDGRLDDPEQVRQPRRRRRRCPGMTTASSQARPPGVPHRRVRHARAPDPRPHHRREPAP